MSDGWIKCSDALPTEGVVVMTKIDDGHSVSNERKLKRKGTLWFHPHSGIYVYYTPTHWKPI